MLKDDVLNLVDEHFQASINQDNYVVNEVDAVDLLTVNRLDIAFKLSYLKNLSKSTNFTSEIYSDHIKAFNFGKVNEYGNDDKNTINKFKESFLETFYSIKENGFDSKKTLIPLSNSGTIANGAHRVASAIFLDKKVSCVQLDSVNHKYDYEFFYSRNVPVSSIESAVTTFIEFSKNIYIAFLWPVGVDKRKELDKVIPNILYKKKIELNYNGAHNLLSQIYFGEPWLGDVFNDFSGVKNKLVECFKTFEPFEVVAFQADNLDEVLKIKEQIRSICNVGKHSVHITDTHEEALRTAQVIFNDNSLHFLNHAKPNTFIDTHVKCDKFKEYMRNNQIDLEDCIIDGSLILSAYGIRSASDIDFLTLDNNKLKFHEEGIEVHDDEIVFHHSSKDDIILNPKKFFYFNEIKFLSFKDLYSMKEIRNEKKDRNDLILMEAKIERKKIKEFIGLVKQSVYYNTVKIRHKLISTLKVLHLYSLLRLVYRKVKNRHNN